MRIGIYKDTLANRRGADMAVLALAEGLRERGHDAVVFEKPDFEKRIAEQWDVVISTGTNELLDLYRHFSLTHSLPPSLTHFPLPIIQQFHTNPKSQFKWKRVLRNWRIKRVLRCVNAIQVLSENFISQVAKYGASVSVIGNWSECRRMGTGESACAEAMADERGMEKTIIFPAAFAKGKNQKLLIEAFARIASEFPGWKLRILGRADGAYADECRQLAKRTGVSDRIDFAGFSDNLAVEYERCAFVAFPSLDEGFGLVIADAAAFAKPCVMVRDWIGTVGAAGGVVTDASVESYAAGLKRLMSDETLRLRMGEAARKFCADNYSRDRILDKWEALLGEVAAKPLA